MAKASMAPKEKKAPDSPPTKGKKEAIAMPTMTKAAPAPKADKAVKTPKAAPAPAPAPESENSGGYTGVVNREKYEYTVHKDQKTASGRASVDNNDPLAAALRGKTPDEVFKLVETNGGEVNPSWENLNQGLARMSAGNVLRKLAKRSEGIKIDGKTLKIAA